MSKLNLTLACGPYDILYPLIEGTASPPGIDLNVLTMASPERHRRMLRYQEFDVCELSLGGYLIAREAGAVFTAIPVFPHRRFRHGYVAINTRAGIKQPKDLNGKRIGLRTLRNSAGLLMRGILGDHYGVDLKSIEWWCQEEEDIAIEPAAWMKVRRVPEGKNIDQMLVAGKLDAAIYPELLPSIRNHSPQVGFLFPDHKQAEMEYYRQTGIYPIMHTVVIRNEILAEQPWAAVSLLQGFQRAKELCYQRMRNPRNLAVVWGEELMQEQESVFGADPWPYNLEDNRTNLEVAVRYAHEEGMIRAKPEIEALFFPASLQETKQYVS
jgi:4,5-dihydroxyphthalate decarboxylase